MERKAVLMLLPPVLLPLLLLQMISLWRPDAPKQPIKPGGAPSVAAATATRTSASARRNAGKEVAGSASLPSAGSSSASVVMSGRVVGVGRNWRQYAGSLEETGRVDVDSQVCERERGWVLIDHDDLASTFCSDCFSDVFCRLLRFLLIVVRCSNWLGSLRSCGPRDCQRSVLASLYILHPFIHSLHQTR